MKELEKSNGVTFTVEDVQENMAKNENCYAWLERNKRFRKIKMKRCTAIGKNYLIAEIAVTKRKMVQKGSHRNTGWCMK